MRLMEMGDRRGHRWSWLENRDEHVWEGEPRALLCRRGSGSGECSSLQQEYGMHCTPAALPLLHGGFLVGGQCLSRRELLHLLLLHQEPRSSQGMHVILHNEQLKASVLLALL